MTARQAPPSPLHLPGPAILGKPRFMRRTQD